MAITIGIDYTAAVHQSAGIGRYTRELINALAALDGRNSPETQQYQLFVANARQDALATSPAFGPNFSWCTTQLSERWLARLWYRLRLPLPIERWTGPIQLFHAPDFVLPPVRRNTRTLVTIHDLSFVRLPKTTMPGMSRHLNQWVPHSVRQADHIIAVSEATRQDLITLFQTPPEKITVLYHGVSPKFRPITEVEQLNTIRQKYKLGDQPFILSVGTIQPRKNYQRLIQAFARVKGNIALVIAGGRGWRDEAVYREVHNCGLQKQVHFTGFIDEADLPVLYSAASLFIYPSLYEGFGLPVLESMACGTPVIASNRSALPEVVGEAGLLVDPYDIEAIAAAMSQLLESEAECQQLSAAGQAQAAQFTWPDVASSLATLYQKIVGLDNKG